MNNETNNKLETMPIVKLVLSMSLPAMLAMMVQAMYNVVDSIFVAQIGEDALAAVSLAFPIQIIVIGVVVGLGVGLSSLISRRLGEKKEKEASIAAVQGVFIGIIVYLLLVIIGIFVPRHFFALYTDSTEIINYGVSYIQIIMFFSFGRIFAQVGMSILQASGDMVRPMKAQLIGAVSNIILDPIFIFGLFGMPRMGVAGAAVATVLGQIFSMIYMLVVLKSGKLPVHIAKEDIKVDLPTIRQILVVGLPAAIMQAVGSLMISGINLILAGFSTTAVAVMGAYYKIQSFIIMPVFGMTQATMPILGYSFGAKNKKRLLETLKVATIGALVIMTVGMVVLQLFPEQLLYAFNGTQEMMEIGVVAFRTISLCLPAAAIGIMLSTVFQASGDGYMSMIVSIVRQLVALLPAAYILGEIAGLNAVWYAFVFGEIVGLLVALIYFYKLYHSKIKLLEQ